jgi:putative ABC transport system ATP-binding protein
MAWWRKSPGQPADEARAPDSKMPVIRLEHVSKIFRADAEEDTHALDDITVDIERGEYVSVSGPSGCGKSTFLSILALLETSASSFRASISSPT